MPDFEKMYFQLAAKVADAIDILVEALQQGENDYIEDSTPIIALIKPEAEQNNGDKK